MSVQIGPDFYNYAFIVEPPPVAPEDPPLDMAAFMVLEDVLLPVI